MQSFRGASITTSLINVKLVSSRCRTKGDIQYTKLNRTDHFATTLDKNACHYHYYYYYF